MTVSTTKILPCFFAHPPRQPFGEYHSFYEFFVLLIRLLPAQKRSWTTALQFTLSCLVLNKTTKCFATDFYITFNSGIIRGVFLLSIIHDFMFMVHSSECELTPYANAASLSQSWRAANLLLYWWSPDDQSNANQGLRFSTHFPSNSVRLI